MKRLHVLGFLGALVSSSFAADFDQNAFTQFKQECKASFNEPWRTIPWKISLLEAQKVAAESGKPIFIWAMDGHPLGCT